MNSNEKMTSEREASILERAIETWGAKLQIVVAIEEMSELQKALCKCLRLNGHEDSLSRAKVQANVLEEMADVGIMLNQLALIFGDCTEQEIAKLERLEGRLSNV